MKSIHTSLVLPYSFDCKQKFWFMNTKLDNLDASWVTNFTMYVSKSDFQPKYKHRTLLSSYIIFFANTEAMKQWVILVDLIFPNSHYHMKPIPRVFIIRAETIIFGI